MDHLKKYFDEGWWLKLSPFLCSDTFKLTGKAINEESKNFELTPALNVMFRAFKECPYDKLKVVLLGLDPYPQKGVADGLAFSAKGDMFSLPKSLKFMIDSIEEDVYNGFAIPYNSEYTNPDLSRWANQGILLLNTSLSTRVGQTGAHLQLWQPFIQNVFQILAQYNTGLIFILLGSQAKMWKSAINTEMNYVLEAIHPAYCAYKHLPKWDCNRVFSKTNQLLEQYQGSEAKILW